MEITQLSLNEEIQFVQQKIRKEPSNPKWRMGLFQRYCQMGKWQKALEQLQVFAQLDADANGFAHAYRIALQAELVREQVFAGQLSPQFPAETSNWMDMLLQALREKSDGNDEAAGELRVDALDLAPTASGSLDGTSFEWLADADTRLGPVCELVLDGVYCWVPYSSFSTIRIAAPENLSDLVWLPAHVQIRGREMCPALIPARYPGVTESTSDEHLRGRLTSWSEEVDGSWIGCGVKVLATGTEEKSLLDIRRIDFDHVVT
jgi:type VI secretion system protein ImpE